MRIRSSTCGTLGQLGRHEARDRFRLSAEAATSASPIGLRAATIVGSPVPLDDLAKYRLRDASFPAYLPDEMRLIQAEVYARQNNLPQALIQLNLVRPRQLSTGRAGRLPHTTHARTVPTGCDVGCDLGWLAITSVRAGPALVDLRRFGKTVKYSFMSVSARNACAT